MNSTGPELKSKTKLVFLALGSMIFGVLFSWFIFKGVEYKKIIQTIENNMATAWRAFDNSPANKPLTAEEIAPNFYFIKNPGRETPRPKISALAYTVGDLDTGEIILAKNQDQKLPIASLSKLMTASTSQDIQNQEAVVKISRTVLKTEGENGNFHLSEKIKTSDLMYPLLLESSNDAAEAVAEYSGRDIFIKKMNDKAKDLGLAQTSFVDPSGLSPYNVSTTLDLFKLTKYIKDKNPDLFKITTERSYANQKHNWSNNSQFLHKDGYLGGKSGYTDIARQTVVSLFSVPLTKAGSRSLAIILLHSPDRYKDVENILKDLKKNVYYGRTDDVNSEWVKAKIDIAESNEPDFVNFVFAGDIMLDRGVKNYVLKNFKGDYSTLFEKLEILKKSDIVFANLEGPASDRGEDMRNLYSFRMDPAIVPALKGAGISILSVANNHVGDFGLEAYINTLARLKENEILFTGGGMNQKEAEEPTIIEKYGLKIGFIGFSDKGPDWLEVGVNKAGVLLTSNPRFDEIIKNAAKQVDYLIVSFHFGEEYQTKHNERQEHLAHRAIDDGAKIVVGHHPHVIEDIEVYKNGFIAYSLGNLIFDQAFSENTMQGMLLEVKLWKDGNLNVKKNTVKLNQFFQPDKIIRGVEEKIKFKK